MADVWKNMNIYSISISHGKNSSHITYIRLNHPWSINRLRMKALDWLREWLTVERVEPLNVKLKGKMGSVFVRVPRGEKPGFHRHTHMRAHTHVRTQHTHCDLALLWAVLHMKASMLPAVWDELCVALQKSIQVRIYVQTDRSVCMETTAGEIVSVLAFAEYLPFFPLCLICSSVTLLSTSFFLSFSFPLSSVFSFTYLLLLLLCPQRAKIEWISFTSSVTLANSKICFLYHSYKKAAVSTQQNYLQIQKIPTLNRTSSSAITDSSVPQNNV